MEAKNSPYYLGNHECLPTELTIKTTEHVVKQELPWDANMEDLCQAFYGALVSITFSPDVVLDGMKNFLIDKGAFGEIEE